MRRRPGLTGQIRQQPPLGGPQRHPVAGGGHDQVSDPVRRDTPPATRSGHHGPRRAPPPPRPRPGRSRWNAAYGSRSSSVIVRSHRRQHLIRETALPSSRADNAATLAYGSARAPYSSRSTLRCSRVRNGAIEQRHHPAGRDRQAGPRGPLHHRRQHSDHQQVARRPRRWSNWPTGSCGSSTRSTSALSVPQQRRRHQSPRTPARAASPATSPTTGTSGHGSTTAHAATVSTARPARSRPAARRHRQVRYTAPATMRRPSTPPTPPPARARPDRSSAGSASGFGNATVSPRGRVGGRRSRERRDDGEGADRHARGDQDRPPPAARPAVRQHQDHQRRRQRPRHPDPPGDPHPGAGPSVQAGTRHRPRAEREPERRHARAQPAQREPPTDHPVRHRARPAANPTAGSTNAGARCRPDRPLASAGRTDRTGQHECDRGRRRHDRHDPDDQHHDPLGRPPATPSRLAAVRSARSTASWSSSPLAGFSSLLA